MAVKRKYRLNLRNYGNLPAIMLSQYDEGYALEFEIRDGTDAASDLSAYTVTLKGTRADTLAYSFAGTISTNVLTFVIDTTMTACAGRGTAEIAIKDTANDVLFATFNMPVFVERAAVPEGSIDADVERAQEIAEQIQEIVDNAAAEVKGEAESWAVGQRDGTDVPATDPTYHNNAKYYSEQAQQAADSIGIDTTLTQAGKAADAKETGDQITELKEDLTNIAQLTIGELNTFPSALFTHGDISTDTGLPRHNNTYRACTIQPLVYDHDIVLYPLTGYRLYIAKVVNGGLELVRWKENPYRMPANQPFVCTVTRLEAEEDVTEIVDIPSFIANIRICRPYKVLDYAKIMTKTEISTSTGVATFNNSSNYSCTDFVAIPDGVKPYVCHYAYTGSSRARVAFYDANKDFISAEQSTVKNQVTTEIPNNAKFIRCGTHSTIPIEECSFYIPYEGKVNLPETIDTHTGGTDYINTPLVSVNHRGYQTVAPENTLPAFAESVRHGFTVIETDLRKTSDGVYVLLHDASINRTARNADGSSISSTVNIADITYAAALEYDFGIWMGSEYAGTKIPTLEEGLIFCQRAGLAMLLEIETGAIDNDADLRNVVGIIKRCGMMDKVTFTCFSVSPLQFVLSWEPSFEVAVNIDMEYTTADFPLYRYQACMTGKNKVWALWHKTRVTTDLINLCKDNGILCGAWLIDSISEALALPPYVTCFTSNALNVSEALKDYVLGT